MGTKRSCPPLSLAYSKGGKVIKGSFKKYCFVRELNYAIKSHAGNLKKDNNGQEEEMKNDASKKAHFSPSLFRPPKAANPGCHKNLG